MYHRAKPTAQQPPRADDALGYGPGAGRVSGNLADQLSQHQQQHLQQPIHPSSRPRINPATATTTSANTPKNPTDHGAPLSRTTTNTSTGNKADLPTEPLQSTLLQPRVAVALGVSQKWYPLLFLCRLASIAPVILFGLPTVLRLLATLHLMYLDRVLDGGGALTKLTTRKGGADNGGGFAQGYKMMGTGFDPEFEARLRLTEMVLAIIWVRIIGRVYGLERRRADLG